MAKALNCTEHKNYALDEKKTKSRFFEKPLRGSCQEAVATEKVLEKHVNLIEGLVNFPPDKRPAGRGYNLPLKQNYNGVTKR